jgi:hypothetical protein
MQELSKASGTFGRTLRDGVGLFDVDGKEIHTGSSARVATGHNVDSTLTDILDGSTGVTCTEVVKGGLSKAIYI